MHLTRAGAGAKLASGKRRVSAQGHETVGELFIEGVWAWMAFASRGQQMVWPSGGELITPRPEIARTAARGSGLGREPELLAEPIRQPLADQAAMVSCWAGGRPERERVPRQTRTRAGSGVERHGRPRADSRAKAAAGGRGASAGRRGGGRTGGGGRGFMGRGTPARNQLALDG